MKPSLVILAHTFIYPALYSTSVLLRRKLHTPICFLSSVQPNFSLHFPQSAPRSCDCPWGKSNGLFPQFSSSCQYPTVQTTFWHPSLPYSSKYYILEVLLLIQQFLCLPFLPLLLCGGVHIVLLPSHFSILPLPHNFKQVPPKQGLLSLALTSPEFCFSNCPISI